MLLLGNDRWALMHELRGADEPPLDYLLGRMQHCDLVLIEGFKNGGFPKLEVWRAEWLSRRLWPDWPGIVAIASDAPLPARHRAAGPGRHCSDRCFRDVKRYRALIRRAGRETNPTVGVANAAMPCAW